MKLCAAVPVCSDGTGCIPGSSNAHLVLCLHVISGQVSACRTSWCVQLCFLVQRPSCTWLARLMLRDV